MSADVKSNSDGNVLLKGESSKTHSLRMSMENVRVRDDTEGNSKGYPLVNSNGHVQTPDPRANNADILWSTEDQ